MRSTNAVSCLVLAAACGGAAWFEPVVVPAADGGPFATVRAGAEPRPYVWPLCGPGGVPMTRDFPMGTRPGEAHDHPHHQSLWFAHGDVDGFDFWHGSGEQERLVPTSLYRAVIRNGGDERTEVDAGYDWTVGRDRVLLHEQRKLVFVDRGAWRAVDLVTRLRPAGARVTFGDTKEGTFALRVHPALRVEGAIATGRLVDSEGREGRAAWGRRARWIDAHGTIDGAAVGVAIFDHPDNPRHPTWWHARTYGLLAANPFGRHDFEGAPDGAGDLVLEPGDELVLRYRVVLHGAGWDRARLDAAWAEWAGAGGVSGGTDRRGR